MPKTCANCTSDHDDAPEREFSDATPDVRAGLERELLAGLDGAAMLKLATRRAIGLRTLALPERMRRMLTGAQR